MRDTVEIKSAMLSYLKSQISVTSLLLNSKEIRESQWQGTDFSYPAIRISVDLFPSINGCGLDRADFVIETFVEEKSSLSADALSSSLYRLLHKHPFASLGVKFPIVVVSKISKPIRTTYGTWKSDVTLTTQCI